MAASVARCRATCCASLAALLRRDPRPECIVIETSGVADPADIVRNLMDPVIWREAPLETVLCVVDATAPAAALDDPLLRSQVRAADVVALSKPDLVDADRIARVRDAVRAIRPGAVVVEALHGALPAALLFSPDPDRVAGAPRAGAAGAGGGALRDADLDVGSSGVAASAASGDRPAGTSVGAGEGNF